MAEPGERQESGVPPYFDWVDALRGIAALIVVVFHYHHFYLQDYRGRGEIPAIAEFPYASILSPLYHYGANAVELFWVISGFVFMHVYLRKKTSFGGFWLARFARLYPLHFATLLFVALIQAINWSAFGTWQIYGENDLRHFGLQLFLATNWSNLSRGLSFNGPIWSVSVEIAAYMLFFLGIWALRRFRLLAAGVICAVCLILSQADWFDPPFIRKALFVCAAYFFFGSCIYFLFLACRGRRTLIGTGMAAFAGTAVLMVLAGQSWLLLPLVSAGLILGAALLDLTAGSLGHRLKHLGDISYSLYLVHVPIQMVFLTVVDFIAPGYRGFAGSYWLLPAHLALSCLLATLVYRWFELPAGRFLRQRLGRRDRPAKAASS